MSGAVCLFFQVSDKDVGLVGSELAGMAGGNCFSGEQTCPCVGLIEMDRGIC